MDALNKAINIGERYLATQDFLVAILAELALWKRTADFPKELMGQRALLESNTSKAFKKMQEVHSGRA